LVKKKAKVIANPFAYAEYRQRVIQKKIEKERTSRIQATKKLPKVNKELANRLMGEETKKKKINANPLQDNRFKELFTNPDFEVDEASEQYKLLHPTISVSFIFVLITKSDHFTNPLTLSTKEKAR